MNNQNNGTRFTNFFLHYAAVKSLRVHLLQHKYFSGYPQTCNLLIPRVWIFNILIDPDKFPSENVFFFSDLYPQPEPTKPVGLPFLSVSWVYGGRPAVIFKMILWVHKVRFSKNSYVEYAFSFDPHKSPWWGFPGGSVAKNPPANAGDTGLISGPERSHLQRSN